MTSKSTKGKRKTSAKKTQTKRKNNARGKGKTAQQNFMKDEIILLCSLGFCILLLIGNFGFGGAFGDALSGFMFGVFGVMAYVMPFLLFIGIAFFISNRGNSSAYIKLTAGTVCLCMICTFMQLVMDGFRASRTLLEYFDISKRYRTEGGIVGGMFAKLFCPAIGVVGAYIIVVLVILICAIVITEKSFLKIIQFHGTNVYHAAKQDAKRKKEERMEKRARKQQLLEEKKEEEARKISEASLQNTTLKKKNGQMHEILPVEEEKKQENVFQDVSFSSTLDEKEGESFVINRAFPSVEDAGIGDDKSEEGFLDDIAEEENTQSVKENRSATIPVDEKESAVEVVPKEVIPVKKIYRFPPVSLLTKGKHSGGDSDSHLRDTALKLEQTLESFGVKVSVTNVSCGPSVTRYEIQPEQGVKVSKIVGLSDDIKLNLAAPDIRIEAPIPGKAAVGIEIPNKENTAVMLRDLLESREFKNHPSNIAFAAGRDIAGKVVVADIQKMPHLLIAGATGSGKSVCINTLIISILYKASPEDVKLIMIDPKVVELSVYNGIPHLMIPVVTDPKKAAGALNWAVIEMTKRYQLFAEYNVRDLKGYNDKIETIKKDGQESGKPRKMPQIVIIVDELADLMMVAPGDVEEAICRLAQLARAAGIHLVIATQRPSVNVITGLIKANMPSRIAFSVTSGVDSRTIIDMNGAEKLLGKGDMLFYPAGYQKPARVQGAFVSDKEVQKVVNYLLKQNGDVHYDEEISSHMDQVSQGTAAAGVSGSQNDRDVYFVDAGKFIIEKDKASIGMLQRVFKIGFNRAARIMDQLCEAGVVGEEEGTKPRKVLMTMEEFERYIEDYV